MRTTLKINHENPEKLLIFLDSVAKQVFNNTRVITTASYRPVEPIRADTDGICR